MMKQRVGIAGYMGSGKSTGARILTRLGGTVLDADAAAKDLMRRDTTIQKELAETFGDDVVHQGTIDFPLLGHRAFHSTDTLRALNAIVHPPLMTYLRTAYDSLEGPVCILDAALIGFWRIDHWFTKRIWVSASRKIRVMRLQKTTHISRATLEMRTRVQEELVAEPDDLSWTHICNEHSQALFEETLTKNIHN